MANDKSVHDEMWIQLVHNASHELTRDLERIALVMDYLIPAEMVYTDRHSLLERQMRVVGLELDRLRDCIRLVEKMLPETTAVDGESTS